MMIFFCLACIRYYYASKKIEQQSVADDISCADYSFYVSGFPSKGVTEDDLKMFFSQYSKVEEVSMARDYSGTLFAFTNYAKLSYQ